jgi:nickel/cobalt transporter (NicO) family protein
MLSLLTGTLILAAIHALIPNHWLPLVAVAKAEGWKKKEITTVTLLAAGAHVFGTIILGLVLGYIGKELEEEYGRAITVAAAILLIVFGLIYFTVNLPHHHHSTQQDVSAYKRSKNRWIWIFIGMMFLSPCLEVESLFLSAGAFGMGAVFSMAAAYAVVSILGIWLLVTLGIKGVNLLPAEFIEHNEKKISGAVLILVGIITFFLH